MFRKAFRQKSALALLAGATLALAPRVVRAIELIPEQCRKAGVAATTEECGLPQLLQVLINVGFLIMGIAGSIALALFVYGGFVWLTSGGSPERITKGKSIIVQTVIALVIIFGAATGVRSFQGALGFQEEKFVQECKDVGPGYACDPKKDQTEYNAKISSGECLAGYCGDRGVAKPGETPKPFEACCKQATPVHALPSGVEGPE
ncbi:MAG: pilin [Patescibacteria group bacterium]|mgnify:CR=1